MHDQVNVPHELSTSVVSVLLAILCINENNITVLHYNLPIKDTLNRGHLSNEDTACCPNYMELCTKLPLSWGHLSIEDRQLDPNGVHYREGPLYIHSCTHANMHTCTHVRAQMHTHLTHRLQVHCVNHHFMVVRKLLG